MKIFIDSSSNYFIISVISNDNEIIAFKKVKTNRDMLKNSTKLLDDFLTKKQINPNDLTKAYLTIGPGSFTGSKISYNILATFNLVKNFKEIYTISSLDLVKKEKKIPYIIFSKSKSYTKEKFLFFWENINIVNNDIIEANKDKYIGYEDFDSSDLIDKINKKKFKKVKNFDKIDLIFVKLF